MKKEENPKEFDQGRRNLLIAIGVVGMAALTGCTVEKIVAGAQESLPTVRPTPTDIPERPTIVYDAAPTAETKPTPTARPKPTEVASIEEKTYLIPGAVYPEEFATETVVGFLGRGDNDYYRPVESGPERETYIKRVYQFLEVNSEVLEPLLVKTKLTRGRTLGELAAASRKTVGEVLQANQNLNYWREQVVSNLATFAVFSGSHTPVELEIPWPEIPRGGGEFNVPPEVKEVWTDQVAVGETALGNKMELTILGQDNEESWKGRPIVFIIGGIHKEGGWLRLVKEYFLNNQSAWEGYRVAFLDANPDGKGRVNPNGVNIQRNFGGPECPSCEFDEQEIAENSLCSSSGRPGLGPNSEPESKAIINAVEYLQDQGEVVFAANLHSAANLVESGACMDNDLNCEITRLIAEKMGVAYILRWDRYACGKLHGEPDEYLRRVYRIPTGTIELSKVEAEVGEAYLCGRAIIEAVDETLSIK